MKKMNTEFDKTLIEFVANSLKNKTTKVDESKYLNLILKIQS